MELWRKAANPWGQEVLVGVSWDLMWLALTAAAVFVIGHAFWLKTRSAAEPPSAEPSPPSAAGLPERIERHSLSARVFHWSMSVATLVLLVTAFVPVMGLQFPWVTLHWIAGVGLVLSVAYHVVHAIGWQDFWSMMRVGADEIREGVAHLRHGIFPSAPEPPKGGKYPFDHKLYHHVIVVVSSAAMVTGLLMMLRVATPFWEPKTYLLSDKTWGVMYVLHGFAGVALIVLVAAHIYFAIRPEKRWITWSMIRGWIDRDHYVAHFDPTKWVIPEKASSGRASGALSDSSVARPREEE